MAEGQIGNAGLQLLPCPFCGALNAYIERADIASSYVVCNTCSARSASCNPENTYQIRVEDRRNLDPGTIAAVEAWNRRAASPAGEVK